MARKAWSFKVVVGALRISEWLTILVILVSFPVTLPVPTASAQSANLSTGSYVEQWTTDPYCGANNPCSASVSINFSFMVLPNGTIDGNGTAVVTENFGGTYGPCTPSTYTWHLQTTLNGRAYSSDLSQGSFVQLGKGTGAYDYFVSDPTIDVTCALEPTVPYQLRAMDAFADGINTQGCAEAAINPAPPIQDVTKNCTLPSINTYGAPITSGFARFSVHIVIPAYSQSSVSPSSSESTSSGTFPSSLLGLVMSTDGLYVIAGILILVILSVGVNAYRHTQGSKKPPPSDILPDYGQTNQASQIQVGLGRASVGIGIAATGLGKAVDGVENAMVGVGVAGLGVVGAAIGIEKAMIGVGVAGLETIDGIWNNAIGKGSDVVENALDKTATKEGQLVAKGLDRAEAAQKKLGYDLDKDFDAVDRALERAGAKEGELIQKGVEGIENLQQRWDGAIDKAFKAVDKIMGSSSK